MSSPLFEAGEFVPYLGGSVGFGINADALSDESITTIAEFIASRTEFGIVEGLTKHGCRRTGCMLADALEKYAVWEAPFNVLIVDDVLDTGASMEKAKAAQPSQVHPDDVVGWVIFARIEPPPWVNAVFQFNRSE